MAEAGTKKGGVDADPKKLGTKIRIAQTRGVAVVSKKRGSLVLWNLHGTCLYRPP